MTRPHWAPEPSAIPVTPGVYRWVDSKGMVLYVGKALNLRRRITDYYETSNPRTLNMVARASSLVWTVVGTETDALVLERAWINMYDPPFNIKLKASGHGARLLLSKGEHPRLVVTYRDEAQSTWGPWPKNRVSDIVDTLSIVTKIATCSFGRYTQSKRAGKPCLLYDLGRCSGPCAGLISTEDYQKIVAQTTRLLNGQARKEAAKATERMEAASIRLDYETAAMWRDRARALASLADRQTMLAEKPYSFDVVWVEDAVPPGWAVVSVRNGVITSVRTGTAVNAENTDQPDAAIALELASELEGKTYTQPGLEDKTLPKTRTGTLGQAVWAAADVAKFNAQEATRAAAWRLLSDVNERTDAAGKLAQTLSLTAPPYRIAALDIAHMQGQDAYAGVAWLVDGKPTRRKTWKIPDQFAGDDFASTRWSATKLAKTTPKDWVPDLLVVDGGPEQLEKALEGLTDAGLDWVCVSLAKRLEEVYLPGQDEPLLLSRTDGALGLLQAARDQAHKTCNTATSKAHAARARMDWLDTVPGVGPARRNALTVKYPTRAAVRQAGVKELEKLPGFGPDLAAKVWDAAR